MTHEAYKWFIDEMVAVAMRCVAADRIDAQGHPVRGNEADLALSAEDSELKQVFLRLGAGDRAILARTLIEERQSALHDFASFLEWALSCDEMSIRWGAEVISEGPFNTMHGDFVGRLNGDEWEKLTQ